MGLFNTRVRLDPKPFGRTLAEYMRGSRRGKDVVANEVGKTVLRRIIAITPPGNSSTNGDRGTALPKEAQRKGKAKVKADILKLFTNGRSKKTNLPPSEIAYAHNRARKGGQVKGKDRGEYKIRVASRALTAYIKRKQGFVGRLVSGWKKAAAKMKVNLPSWVMEHNAPGFGTVTTSGDRVRIRFGNATRYAEDVAAIYRRIRAAFAGQQKAMENKMKNKADEAAKRAGLRVTK
jgi:hypothetical protein